MVVRILPGAVPDAVVNNNGVFPSAAAPLYARSPCLCAQVEQVKEKNQENPVIVYSKSWCPYCAQVGLSGVLKDKRAVPQHTCSCVQLSQTVKGAHTGEAAVPKAGRARQDCGAGLRGRG